MESVTLTTKDYLYYSALNIYHPYNSIPHPHILSIKQPPNKIMARNPNTRSFIKRRTKQEIIDLIKSKAPELNKKTKEELVNILEGKIPNIDKKTKKELVDIFKGVTPEINNLNKRELVGILMDITTDINKNTKQEDVEPPKDQTIDVNETTKQEHVDPPEDQTTDVSQRNMSNLFNFNRPSLLDPFGIHIRDANQITRQEVLDIIESKTKGIDDKKQEIDDKKNEMVDYWKGPEEEDGKRKGGMETYIQDQLKEIDQMLAGATSHSLSGGYQKTAKRHRILAQIYSGTYLLIILMIFASLILTILSVDIYGEILGYPVIVTLVTTTTIGVWLSSFFKNKQKEERRIEEEYSHKEMITKVFEGYRKEIKNIDEGAEGQRLLLKLYDNMIDSADYNPSQHIGKYDTEHPVLSIFKSIMKSNKKNTPE